MQLTIGKLAKQAKVSIETVRYYQRIGLLQIPEKPNVGYRLYPSNTIDRIQFIKRAQQAGFTFKETTRLLTLDGTHCEEVRKLAEQKRQQIDSQIKNLTALRNTLDNLVKRCHTNTSTERCSLMDALSSTIGE